MIPSGNLGIGLPSTGKEDVAKGKTSVEESLK